MGLRPKYNARRISSIDALAKALCLTPDQLFRLASQSDQYYVIHDEVEKPDGSMRVIYNTRHPLKEVLRRINRVIFRNCCYPHYLVGSLPSLCRTMSEEEIERGEADYIQNARRHSGRGTVIRIDASNFFPSIPTSLVNSVWTDLLGFSEDVAEVLTTLATFQGQLTQGAPTSSYIANLALWKHEPYIVQQLESEGIRYTRYVDDIIVSSRGKLTTEKKSKVIKAAQKVFLANRLKVKTRKTEVMDSSNRQTVHGVVVNSGRPTSGKERRKLLRAELHRFKLDCHSPAYNVVTLMDRYRSLDGKLRELSKLNPTAGDKLLRDLQSHRPA